MDLRSEYHTWPIREERERGMWGPEMVQFW